VPSASSRVKGRTDDMLVIRGVNVFPSEIERVLTSVPELAPHYQVVVERPDRLDEVTVEAEVREGVRATDDLERSARGRLAETLGLSARVTLLPPQSIARSEGKALRVLDRRGSP
jgi:phenylacetate-CoA ligase